MKIFERLFWSIIIIGIFFKLLHLSGSNEMIFFGSDILALFYLIFGAALFNGISAGKAFSKSAYANLSSSQVWAGIGLGLGFSCFATGVGLKLLTIHLGNPLLVIGAVIINLVIGFMGMRKNAERISRATYLRVGFALVITVFLFFISVDNFIRFWHHGDDPAYIDQIIYVRHHPEDLKASEKLDSMRYQDPRMRH